MTEAATLPFSYNPPAVERAGQVAAGPAPAAQALAKRILSGGNNATDDAERLGHAFRLCLLREPTTAEQTSFSRLLEQSRAWYSEKPEEAKKIVGKYQPDGVAPEDAAAWVATARVLLNMDEFLTRE